MPGRAFQISVADLARCKRCGGSQMFTWPSYYTSNSNIEGGMEAILGTAVTFELREWPNGDSILRVDTSR